MLEWVTCMLYDLATCMWSDLAMLKSLRRKAMTTRRKLRRVAMGLRTKLLTWGTSLLSSSLCTRTSRWSHCSVT